MATDVIANLPDMGVNKKSEDSNELVGPKTLYPEQIGKEASERVLSAAATAVAGLDKGGSGLLQQSKPLAQSGVTVTANPINPQAEDEQRHPFIVGDVLGGAPAWVYTKAGRIIRVTPMTFTEEEAHPWSITAGGKTYTPEKKTHISTFDQAFRRIVYASNRVKYPLKRVGFEPGGKSSVENRGKGEFVRITWDEAFDILASELKRMKTTYGNSAIAMKDSGHGIAARLHTRKIDRFLTVFGGHTPLVRNTDSAEGFFWGGYHHCGFMFNPTGYLGGCLDVLEDVLQNTKLLVVWAEDALTTYEGEGNDSNVWWNWIKDLGIKIVAINVDCNELTSKLADKWIPIYPGTDAALMAAIAYQWIKDDTYDKEYVKTHSIGFDKFKEYVMGDEDGIPKTPQWAEKITGVKARITRALAKEWASKTTSISTHCMAGRGPYGSEHCRMAILLLVMQGYGKPGVTMFSTPSAPTNPDAAKWSRMVMYQYNSFPQNKVMQSVFYTQFPGGILNPPVSWYGGINGETVEPGKAPRGPPSEVSGGDWGFHTNPTQQFWKATYPTPGLSEIHMYWSGYASMIANWNGTYEWMKAFRSPKLEFICIQVPWFEGDCHFADLVLPVTTPMEQNDICGSYAGLSCTAPKWIWKNAWGNDVYAFMEKCIEPIGESKSDLEITTELARKLGFEREFSDGMTLDEMMKLVYKRDCPASKVMSLDDFKKKGYYVVKFPDMETYKRSPGLRWYHDQPEGKGLRTPSGKFEFESTNLKKFFPDDKERAPVPHYVAEGITHQESRLSKRGRKYPLLLATSHSRFGFHSRYRSATWLWETTPRWMIKAKNGVWTQAMWMNPIDAEDRHLSEGDIVKVFNDRGTVLSAVHITEFVPPGVVRQTFGANYRPAGPAAADPLMDTNGMVAAISPYKTISANCFGFAVGWFLVQVEGV